MKYGFTSLRDMNAPGNVAINIRNSINIPHEILLSNIDLVSEYNDEPLVVYCRSGKRASLVIEALKKHGFTNVVDIEGDILAWSQSNYPLVEQKIN